MNRRSLIVGAAALACASVTPALSAECDVDNAMDLMRMIYSDIQSNDLSRGESLELMNEYLTYCKKTYPGFDYRVEHDGRGYSVYMSVLDAKSSFHVITFTWADGVISLEGIVGAIPQ